MTTFTEIVAAVVVHSSAVAYSHFGVTLEPVQVDHPVVAVERTIARTTPTKPLKAVDCPIPRPRTMKT